MESLAQHLKVYHMNSTYLRFAHIHNYIFDFYILVHTVCHSIDLSMAINELV